MTKKTAFATSFVEVLMTFVISTFPITIGAFTIIVKSNSELDMYFSVLCSIIKDGELFIYTASLMAPIVFITLYNAHGKRIFSYQWFFILYSIIILLLASSFFGIEKKNETSDSIFIFSIILFLVTYVVYFIALVMNYYPKKAPEEIMKDDEDTFADEYAKRRRGTTQ